MKTFQHIPSALWMALNKLYQHRPQIAKTNCTWGKKEICNFASTASSTRFFSCAAAAAFDSACHSCPSKNANVQNLDEPWRNGGTETVLNSTRMRYEHHHRNAKLSGKSYHGLRWWFGEVIDAYRIRSVQVPPVWWKAFPLSHVADSLPPAALVEGRHSVKLPDMEVVPMIPMLNLCVHPSILRWKILSKIIFHHPSCSFRTSLLLFVSPRPGVSGPPPVISWVLTRWVWSETQSHKGQKNWEESWDDSPTPWILTRLQTICLWICSKNFRGA